MAVVSPIFLVILTISFYSSASQHDPEFHTLNVSASLQQTREVFSPKSWAIPLVQRLNLANYNSSANSFTLTLHPRYSLPFAESFDNNYTALSLARLAQDEAHVRSRFSMCSRPRSRHSHHRSRHSHHHPRHSHAHSRHSHAHSRNSRHHSRRSRAHAHPSHYYAEMHCQEKLQAPLISGVRLGSGEYFARIGFGQPAKEFFLVLDTGSDITWIQCKPCAPCYQQSDPLFNPLASATYTSIPCSSSRCRALYTKGCLRGNCVYEVSYGDGSYTIGELANETLTFGTTGSVPHITFGCGHRQEGLFSGSAGLLGIGLGPLSTTTQIKATSFSYCLVDRDSSRYSTLEFNAAAPPDSILAPMVSNPLIRTYYYVGLAAIIVGGQPVRIPPSKFEIQANGLGGVIVDSGTAISRFHPEDYATLRDTFRSLTTHLPPADGISLFDTCYNLSSMPEVSVPTLSFLFRNGEKLTLRASNYVIPVGDDGRCCFAFAETSGPTGIIGNVQQMGTRVTFDMVHQQIGFSQNKC